MSLRLKAFGIHLLSSAIALSLVLGALYLGWYRWPGWYLTGVVHVLALVALVDVALGPTVTLIIASPKKPRRELARDIAIVVTVQLAALAYGSWTLWQGRPLYYTFSSDRLEIVQASDLSAAEIKLARSQNVTLVPHWYSLPRWVWAPLPADKDQATKIMTDAIFGGTDVIEMPRYFKPWDQGLPDLRQQLKKLDDIKPFTKPQKIALGDRMVLLGADPKQPNALVIWGREHPMLAVFDPTTLRIRGFLAAKW